MSRALGAVSTKFAGKPKLLPISGKLSVCTSDIDLGKASCTDEQSASFERRQRVQQVRISQEVHDSQTTYAISSRASILIDDEVNGSENLGTFLARSIQFVEYVLHILSLIVLYFGLSLLVVFGGLILVNPIKSGTNTSLPTSPPPKPFFSGALLAAAVAGSWDQTSRLLEEGA